MSDVYEDRVKYLMSDACEISKNRFSNVLTAKNSTIYPAYLTHLLEGRKPIAIDNAKNAHRLGWIITRAIKNGN